MKIQVSLSLILATVVLMLHHVPIAKAQILDRVFENNRENQISDGRDLLPNNGGSPFMPMIQRLMGVLNVNVPGIYNMTKEGNSMGINVLSGLVRVDRGREAERSGLQGPRPLSVRVFGVPVYERGVRTGGSSIPSIVNTNNGGSVTPQIPSQSSPPNDDELPLDP